jgi:hypothetical protein
MKDYFGREIKAGDFLIKGGDGNSAGEYGMILYFVDKVDANKISATRLRARCNSPYTDQDWQLNSSKSNLTKSLACLVVDPPDDIKNVFLQALSNPDATSVDVKKQIAYWLHGSKCLIPE